MKIGIDGRAANWYRGTGIGTYTYQILKHINEIDIYNNYVVFAPPKVKNNIKFNSNVSIVNILKNYKKNFWEEINVPNSLGDKNIDIYHVPQNGIGLPKNKTCSFVITLHDIIPCKMPETVSSSYLKLFHSKMPNIIKSCDGIITVSEYSKQDIIKTFNIPKEKIFVTHLASENIYKPLNKHTSKNLIKKYYSIDNDYILYVGGFSPRKNIIGLIEAFSKLVTTYKKDINLVIAGTKGKSYPIYKKRCEELNIENKVIFPGFIPLNHMPYMYNGCKFFVYPSFYEGFGLPPVEAMACGVPVIASNTTSVPEVVSDAALLINPYNIDELYNSMLKILNDNKLIQTLKTKGLQRSSEFTWTNTCKNTIIAYNKILNK